MQALLYLLIGLAAGGFIAVIGTGAGLIIIPALVFLAHFSTKTAIGTSLTLLLPPVGIFAAYAYWKQGAVDVRASVFIILGFLIGSLLMSHFATNLSSETLSKIFGIASIAIGIKMLLL
jgi:uncharacterized membrane protein YfcA